MYQWTITKDNTSLLLTGQEKKWQLLSVGGINPTAATINQTSIIGADGSNITSSKVEAKNLIFTLKINGRCEDNRDELMNYFMPKAKIKAVCKSKNKNVYIDGVVESCEYEVYTNNQTMQISVICPYPYFKNVEERLTDNIIETGGITFPFSIEYYESITLSGMDIANTCILYNYGQTITGLQIDITMITDQSSIKISNVDNLNEYIGFNYDFLSGDHIHIDTNMGVINRATLTRSGVTTNLLSKLMANSTWIKLDTPVKALFGYPADTMFIYYRNRDELVGI